MPNRMMLIDSEYELQKCLRRIDEIETILETETITYYGVIFYRAQVIFREFELGCQVSHGMIIKPIDLRNSLLITWEQGIAKHPFDRFIQLDMKWDELDKGISE